MLTRWTVWAPFVLLIAGEASSLGQRKFDFWVGDTVIVVRDVEVEKPAGGSGMFSAGDVLTVEKLDGERVQCRGRRARNSYWLSKQDILSVEQTIAGYSQAIVWNPRDTMAFRLRAAGRAEQGEYLEALEDLAQALFIKPSAAVYDQRAGLRYERGEYEVALRDLNKALMLRSSRGWILGRRGWCLYRMGDYRRALADFDAAIQRLPKDSSSYLGRAESLLRLDDHAAALRAYDEYLKLEPTDSIGFYRRGCVKYWTSDYDEALVELNEAIRLEPKLAEAFGERARTYYQLKNYEASFADCQEARRLAPQCPDWYFIEALGRSDCPVDDYRNGALALELALKACELTKYRDPRAVGSLAAAYGELKQYGTAIDYLEQAVKLTDDPALKRAYAKRAASYSQGMPVRR